MKTEHIDLDGTTPGTRHVLTVHRFGTPGARPQVYVQAALHADEIPGMLAAHYLRQMLMRKELEGLIQGEIILVPFANPIGLAQRILGVQVGRFDVHDGNNFNRYFPDLLAQLPDNFADHLSQDQDRNVAVLRKTFRELIGSLPRTTPAQHLKAALLSLAIEADWVLDLHCDGEATMHLYTLPALANAFQPLAALLQAEALLVADVSGDDPFDEACSRPWTVLAQRYPGHPMPIACKASTVELRGQADVDPVLAEGDATALVHFMTHAGAISGSAPQAPPLRCRATALEAVEALIAPCAGIIAYHAKTGQHVDTGALIAEIIDPELGSATPVRAGTRGILFARAGGRFAVPGKRLGKIAGEVPLRSGKLLSP
jgi:uncharacterized protein